MARPRSEDKHQALLEAATEIVASHGLAAPTAQIARRAGVAEGTLFRYFATKDVLVNALYLHLKGQLCTALQEGFDPAASLKARAEAVWNNYIDWGIANPTACRAMSQLAVSGKILPETHAAAVKLFPALEGLTSACCLSGLDANQSDEFRRALMASVAQVAMSFSSTDPARAAAYKASGFAVMWRTLTDA